MKFTVHALRCNIQAEFLVLRQRLVAYFQANYRPVWQRSDDQTALVVSLTTFPERSKAIETCIQSICSQDLKPDRIVLVLARDEFGYGRLPRSIQRCVSAGVDIIWIENSQGPYNKLIPALRVFPSSMVITVDDDCIYEPWMVRELVETSSRYPGSVVGHRGRRIQRENGALCSYESWNIISEFSFDQDVFLTGVGGVLYPPNVLDARLIGDSEAIAKCSPDNDDLWFWAAAKVANSGCICTGLDSYVYLMAQRRSRRLGTANVDQGQNDAQLLRTLDHVSSKFGSLPQMRNFPRGEES